MWMGIRRRIQMVFQWFFFWESELGCSLGGPTEDLYYNEDVSKSITSTFTTIVPKEKSLSANDFRPFEFGD